MSKTPEELKAVASKDRDLIRFIISESKKYDRWEIFLRAQEQVESLKQENVLDLHLRYHRVLYPLITCQSSDEWKNLNRSDKKQEEVRKEGVEPRKIRASSSTSDQEESCLWIIMDEPNSVKFGKPVDVLPIGSQSSVHYNNDYGKLSEDMSGTQKSKFADATILKGTSMAH